ncbi:hypothetical protein [Streptosporangium amethystogenes]|nr:hypothetical protein [Streptosporangium amethystogenes]
MTEIVALGTGVISPGTFTVLVLMALIATMMTVPLLRRLELIPSNT